MKRLLFLVFLLGILGSLQAQHLDSLRVTVGTLATLASQGYQPLWSVANRYGSISSQQADLSTFFTLGNEHALGAAAVTAAPRRRWVAGYGLAVYNNRHFRSTFLQEGYGKVGYGAWQLRAGRYRETTGTLDPSLSSGSFGISGNALPLPKVELAVTEYTNVPFTRSLVQFKGNFAHGWFGSQGFIKKYLLHQKSLYVKVGRDKLSVYGGLTHFAQWGGVFPSGRAPSRFKDYLRIVAARSGNAADPVYQQGPIDNDNAVGNHLLVPDFGLTFRKNHTTIRLYTQTIFDKGVADTANLNQRDQIKGLKILGRDRLLGLSWENPTSKFLQNVLVEGIYTKYQGGPILYQGRDNYYNNGTYNVGWLYKDRIIGTPLFISQQAARQYQLNPSALAGGTVISNRVAGVHAGLKGRVAPTVAYRILATHLRHYGNYYNDAYFTPAKRQTSLLAELPCRFSRLAITPAVAYDFGDLSSNVAGLLRLEWVVR
ncbi:hypothetical protein J0X19_13840 [Hymenobacter sp. BT186]|uniref:Capsule assembly Wzi family protein n=1 Tax=Hymenobacter telluris TaxID=2816474 RepID=A0A939JBD8_9BACT|nr:capsule assembly Wzi family protein [Hymenobacter telluris]MBO0359036.1 hypothetical protein [Hymenobacter telluris]MBW3375062.1 capsule assembly Wzi family protein [Hymenobacter norwichensis]